MAHYLSDVTHQYLEQRITQREDESDWASPPSSEVFDGRIRAMEVASHGHENNPNKVTIWTADQEGTISVRDIKGRSSYVIDKKPEVHVSALLAHGPYMWVGLSDGYLRIFDQKSYELCFERKQHSGRITCMIAVGADVYTGSDDWLIYKWAAKSFEPIKQLSGHQCSVLCMAYDGGDVLFSGSEDFTIRCWDLELGEERLGQGWPARNHSDGVTALVIYEIHLFSASRDGTIKVWNTQTGGMMKFLDRREGSITCLFKDPSAARIWAGGTDGFISVYDAFSLRLITRMQDHRGTYVKALGLCKRLSAMKVWSVNEEGAVKVWYADEDHPYSMYSDRAVQLQSVVEEKRWQLTDNYRKIEEHKEEHRRLVDRDDRRKRNMAQEMGFKSQKALESEYYSRALNWVALKREEAKKRQCAEALTRPSALVVLRVYYHKLATFRQIQQEQRRLENVSQHVGKNTLRNLQSAYFQNLLQYVLNKEVGAKRDTAALALSLKSTTRTYGVYYLRWLRWIARRKQLVRRGAQAGALNRQAKALQVNAFYKRIVDFSSHQKDRSARALTSMFLTRYNDAVLMTKYYSLLFALIKRRRHQRLAAKKGAIFVQQAELSNARKHFYFLWQFVAFKQNERLQETVNQEAEENAELERVMLMQGDYTDDQIDAELAKLNDELAQTLAEIDNVNRGTEALQERQVEVRWEISKARVQLPEGSQDAQLRHVMQLLKAHSVHCQRDFDQLTEIREEGKKIGPSKMYDEGVRKCRMVVAQETIRRAKKLDNEPPRETMTKEHVWILVDSVDSFSKKAIRSASLGIRDMVIAYDMMTINPTALQKLGHAKEVLYNAGVMLDIIDRARGMSEKDLKEGRGSSRKKSSSKKKKGSSKKKKSSKKKSLTDGTSTPKKVSKKKSSKKKSSSKKKKSLTESPAKKSSSKKKVSKKKSSTKKKKAIGDVEKTSTKKKKVSKKKSSSKKKVSKKKSSTKKKKKTKTTTKKTGTKKKSTKKKSKTGTKKKSTKKKSKTGTKKKASHPASAALTSKKAVKAGPKPWLGMRINMEDTSKVVIADVERNSPANSAGLGDDDVIVMFGDRHITDVPSFQASFKEHCRIGAAIPMRVHHNGDESRVLETVLHVGSSEDRPEKPTWVSGTEDGPPAAAPEEPQEEEEGDAAPAPPADDEPEAPPADDETTPWMGMRINRDDDSIVICADVDQSGPAARAGLGDNDVITNFGGDEITDFDSFKNAYAKHAAVGAEIAISVLHDGDEPYSTVLTIGCVADRTGEWVAGAEHPEDAAEEEIEEHADA